jgi:hypothetical protein
MNNTTGVLLTVSLIQVCTSLMAASVKNEWMTSFYKKTPFAVGSGENAWCGAGFPGRGREHPLAQVS